MDKQIKLLDEQYITTRIRELKEVRQKKVTFNIYKSDREFSKTLYIDFYLPQVEDKKFKGWSLRMSDHLIKEVPEQTQFIVNPNEDLTKKKKQHFMRTLENTVKKAQNKLFRKTLNKIFKNGEN